MARKQNESGTGPADEITDATRAAFHGPLLAWYRANARDLPWRRLHHDPYAIWVSEIMLQQTQVATVIPFYERWMARFPTLLSLAEAPLEEALRYWAGLGYYARARNMHRAAEIVAAEHGGVFPNDLAALSKLPGIGRYTAGAVLSMAFNQPAPIVDTNVIRVLTRVFGIGGDPKGSPAQARLWHLAEALIPPEHPRDFNQAVMELGARVCTPADPVCDRCPLLPVCHAGNSPDPTAWPELPAGKATVRVTHCSIVLREGEKVLLTRRPPHGLWGGLWEFPRRVCAPGEDPAACAVRAAREVVGVEARKTRQLGTVRHGVTHHAITLHGFEGVIIRGEPQPLDCAEVRWITLEEADALPLSAPQAQLVAQLHESARTGQGSLF
jgi:A/G-specific adenine glycosylase